MIAPGVLDRFASLYLGQAGVVRIEPSTEDGADILVVGSTDPRAAVALLPVRFEGIGVRLQASAPLVHQAETRVATRERTALAEVLPVAHDLTRGLPGALGLVDPDAATWDAIETGADPLQGGSFDAAVAHAPERVEALVHQRIHATFHAILQAPQGMRGTEAGMLQRETYLLRNRALREVHGRITAANLADSLERNWEDYSRVLQWMTGQAAAGQPGAVAYLGLLQANQAELSRAFREAQAIATRAGQAAQAMELRDPDVVAWARIAAVTRAMGSFVEDQLHLPVRGGGPRRLP